MADGSPAPSILQQIRAFRGPFWAANVMELIERLAYYGVRVVLPVYIASSEDPNGLHFTNEQKGGIFTVWALLQALLPFFIGGFADRYGGKASIVVSVAVKVAGYLIMASTREFYSFAGGCMLLALGTAFFVPGVQGTLVRGTTPQNSSVGWGIFYNVVNIGGALGVPLAGWLKVLAWKWVFVSCAAIVSLNLLVLLTYREEPQGGAEAADKRTPIEVLKETMAALLEPRLLVLVLVTSGYWAMYVQLFDSLPNFIEEWTDSSSVLSALGITSAGMFAAETPRGLQIPQEWMINLNSASIVLLMVPIAAMTARFKRTTAIWAGIFISVGGIALSGYLTSGWICLAGIFVFSVGEMVCSPKQSEYFGVIAPRGKESLYMGLSNVPYALGWVSGAYVAGSLYDRWSDKANLARRYLIEVLHMDASVAAAIPRMDVVKVMAAEAKLTIKDATRTLWETYQPTKFWTFFVAVGVLSGLGSFAYARIARRWKELDV